LIGPVAIRPPLSALVQRRFNEEPDMEERSFDRSERRRAAIDESDRLIASDKVEGTAVYNREGDKLGAIRNFMVDKRSGEVDYAVLSFGGLLGMGEKFYPLPWEMLTYDVRQKGYVVDIDKETLENAPSFGRDEPTFDRQYGERIYGAYGLTYPY
jgi:hypothetical protein